MTKYVVTGAVCEIGPPHKLRLSKGQAADRAHAVRRVKGGLFEATGPLQFKKGETVDFPSGCPKGLAGVLTSEAELKKAATADQKAADKEAMEVAKAAEVAAARQAEITARRSELITAYDGDDAAKAKFETADAYADAVIAEEFPA